MEPIDTFLSTQDGREAPSSSKLQLGPRVRHEIELRTRELEARQKRTLMDQRELDRLRELLKGSRVVTRCAVLAACLVLTPLTFPARAADDGYGITAYLDPDSTACDPYHEARRCLAAIRRLTNDCSAKKPHPLSSDDALDCINEAIATSGGGNAEDDR